MFLQVFGQVLDALREQCNLYLRRTGVALFVAILGDDTFFVS